MSKASECIRAEEMFFSSQGRLSYSELAALVCVNKRTIVRWSAKYQWQARAAELAALVQQKVSEKMAETLSQRAAALAEQSLEPLERISHLVNQRLDNPTLDTEHLRPADLRQLAMAQDAIIRNSRLLAGEPTSHEQLSGKVSLEIEPPGFVDKIIQKIIRTGDVEGQLRLMALQEALQALIEDKD